MNRNYRNSIIASVFCASTESANKQNTNTVGVTP